MSQLTARMRIMRKPITFLAGMAVSCLAAAASEPFVPKPAMRDRATQEELVEKLRKAADPIKTMVPAPASDPAKVWKPTDLLERSEFFSMGDLGTLVPKGAVLHVPAAYASRRTMAAGVRIVPWLDFHAANRGWIQTMEVTREQAEGSAPFTEEMAKALEKSPFVVVATLKGCPISVLPPKPPAAGAVVPDTVKR